MNRNTLFPLALAVLGATRPAAAQEPAKGPPPAIKTMMTRLVGTWSAHDVSVTVDGKPMKAKGRVDCKNVAGGGVQCHVQSIMPGMKEEETNLLGWDPEGGKVHLFAVNQGYTHDHVGTLEGQILSLAYNGTRDGKPWEETLTFTFKNDRELVWKDSCKAAGQVVFSGEGTYRK
jgi:hypothetical protein